MNRRPFFLGLFLCLPFATHAAFASGGPLYSTSPFDAFLRTVDPLAGTTLTSVPMSHATLTVFGCNDIDFHPTTGELWAVLRVLGFSRPQLAKVDPNTGTVTIVGDPGQAIATTAFDASGLLYGVTGGGSPTPDSLFRLDQGSGAATFLRNFHVGGAGEAIAFHPSSGLLYHASGNGLPNTLPAGEILETVDLGTLATNNVPLSGFDSIGTLAMTHWVGDVFLFTDFNNELLVLGANGVLNQLAVLDHTSRGIAFGPPPAGAFFAPYGRGCPSNGGYMPVLTGAGKPASPSLVSLEGFNAGGGSFGYLFLGTGTLSVPISLSCSFHNLPLLGFGFPVTFAGIGAGAGAFSFAIPIPPGLAPFDLYFQALILDLNVPGSLAMTNALQAHVQ